MKNFLRALILLNVLLLLGCGSDSSSSNQKLKRYSRLPKKVLTESEKNKYITPTIYYIADYSDIDNSKCIDAVDINFLKSKNNVEKIKLCKEVYRNCKMQGSCFIDYNSQKTMINYHKKINDGLVQFMLVDRSLCKHGMGDTNDGIQSFKMMCLDPFYSVAADTSIYPLGTVIYIQAIRGTALPDGSTHDGYFIVRDSGGNIEGRGRFDFFTGHLGLKKNNPFYDLGLGGESNFDYQVVSKSEAEVVIKRRFFPFLIVK